MNNDDEVVSGLYSVPTADLLMRLNGFSPVVKTDAPGALAYLGNDERIAPRFRVD
jgi:hypothetical protein